MRTMEDVQLEVMKSLYTYESSSLEAKAKYAYDVMKDLFKVSTDGRRFKDQKNLIYMLMFYTARMANNNNTSLASIGVIISKLENRSTKYDHSSIIHGIKKHIERVQMGKRGGWGEYVEQFDTFCTAIYNSIPVYDVRLDALSTSIISKATVKNKHNYGYLQRS